ncbi:hypothetical protein COCSADRAFT_266776 [Bipolaris sorokiniana ND90Pr]|uniref:Uncharacterized protein n=1 Tax=Cochliobolus sativus (strain ND90Pr / ATCC 201652) TaxID=665912 RepID=M2T027_COCSN|nr:uncharacterized protein COCSADRAFT_266776 [Bipolaris sorokiniana ND90Pr]EMD67920.1 hypothetical protein COCSADRAFT_266776 [Bipolaris sorokiniana ND90Pr]
MVSPRPRPDTGHVDCLACWLWVAYILAIHMHMFGYSKKITTHSSRGRATPDSLRL